MRKLASFLYTYIERISFGRHNSDGISATKRSLAPAADRMTNTCEDSAFGRQLSFLYMLLLIVTLLLTGCGTNNQSATGLPSDSVNKVSNNIEETRAETKSNDTSLASENKTDVSDGSKAQVESVKTDVPKTTDNVQSQDNAAKVVAEPTTTSEANPSSQTPINQVPIPMKVESADTKTVTISINCQTAVGKGLDKQEKFKEVVPSNGIILPPTKIEFKDGETVFDALKQVTRENNIQIQYEGSKGNPYIKGINNLYEFDGGPISGWMYCVNKLYANYGSNETKLKNGDAIEWNYSCNMGKDLGQK